MPASSWTKAKLVTGEEIYYPGPPTSPDRQQHYFEPSHDFLCGKCGQPINDSMHNNPFED